MSVDAQAELLSRLASENVSDVRLVAWDTETTGVSTARDHIVEIAASAFDEEYEHRRFETLVKSPIPMPEAVVKIHGIDDAMLADAPDANSAVEQFGSFLKLAGAPRLLLAHNAGFDVGMLLATVKRLRKDVVKEFPREIVLDTCMLAKRLLPDLPHHSVEALARHLKIESVRYHRAAQDVKALHLIFLQLLGLAADQCGRGEKLTISRLIDLAGGYFLIDLSDSAARQKPFCLPPRISVLESLCGSGARVGIEYVNESDYRYITPLAIKVRAFGVYLEAFCHRDNIKKTFRADRITRIGKIEQ